MAATTFAQFSLYLLHFSTYPALLIVSYYLIVKSPDEQTDDVEYNFAFTLLFTGLRLLPLLSIPRLLITLGGLLTYVRCYVKHVPLNGPPLMCPFICFRTVTKGDYPHLVQENVKRNIQTCFNVGLHNFMVEVVTDSPLHLNEDVRVRETVVPGNYVTSSGVMYKGRALQYCLEDGVNELNDHDWLVHLDEETLLTENSVRGIINFLLDGKHQFGQGIVTYNNNPVNEFLTLMDAIRVGEDVGAIGGTLRLFHKPLLSWKGSFCVCQVGAEKHVSFDYGPAASVAEDCQFCLVAFKHGYSFDFVEGEMQEQSPYTLRDFMLHRKRWFEGKWLTIWNDQIPLRCKILVILDFVSWMLTPVLVMNAILEMNYSLPRWGWCNALNVFLPASFLFIYTYGVIKSHTLASRKRFSKLVLQLVLGVLIVIPFYTACYLIVIVCYIVGKKRSFHVVQKSQEKLTPLQANGMIV